MGHPNVTVQIIAGGRSLRMGRDKAQLRVGGRSLLEWAVAQWDNWGNEVMVSVGDEERRHLAPPGTKAICDRHPGRGPMEGLYSGAIACDTELLLLRAVDTPFLLPAQAEPLLMAIGGADACVYQIEGRLQPLFGLYRAARCRQVARVLLDRGEYRMKRLLELVHTTVLPAPEPACFFNINTPEEMRAAKSMMERDLNFKGRCTLC